MSSISLDGIFEKNDCLIYINDVWMLWIEYN